MRYPSFLKPNGKIGFIAPSFGCAMEPYASCFDAVQKRFREMGYQCVEGPNCRVSEGLGKSNTPQLCGAEINDFFINDRCDAIISCGGGETMCEDLPFVDFNGIASAPPKWFMGYSDNTNLVFTLPTLCDTAAIYGPCAPSFGVRKLHPSQTDALGVLTGQVTTVHNYDGWELQGTRDEDHPFDPYCISEPFAMKRSGRDGNGNAITDGSGEVSFHGRLLGGCLDVLICLCGTRFDQVKAFNERYAEDGVIWFLEACELRPIAVRRALWQLENAGWFENARGFLIGRPDTYGANDMGLDHYEAVSGALQHHGVPILMDLDIGHKPPMMPLVSGAVAQVDADCSSIRIRQSFL